MDVRVRIDKGRYEKLLRLAENNGVSVEDYAERVLRASMDKQASPRLQALNAFEQLNSRQQDILMHLVNLRLATREQVGNLFGRYPHDESANIAGSRALVILQDLGLAEEHRIQFRIPGRATRKLFSATDLGVYVDQVLRGRKRITSVPRPYPPRLISPERLPHYLDVVDVASAFATARNKAYGSLAEIELEATLWTFPHLGSLRRIRPDSFGLFLASDQVLPFAVEVVRNEFMNSLIRKIRNYAFFYSSGAYITETLDYPTLLLVASGKAGADHLCKSVVYGMLQAFLSVSTASKNIPVGVTTLTQLAQEGPFLPIWGRPLHGDLVGFLELYADSSNRLS